MIDRTLWKIITASSTCDLGSRTLTVLETRVFLTIRTQDIRRTYRFVQEVIGLILRLLNSIINLRRRRRSQQPIIHSSTPRHIHSPNKLNLLLIALRLRSRALPTKRIIQQHIMPQSNKGLIFLRRMVHHHCTIDKIRSVSHHHHHHLDRRHIRHIILLPLVVTRLLNLPEPSTLVQLLYLQDMRLTHHPPLFHPDTIRYRRIHHTHNHIVNPHTLASLQVLNMSRTAILSSARHQRTIHLLQLTHRPKIRLLLTAGAVEALMNLLNLRRQLPSTNLRSGARLKGQIPSLDILRLDLFLGPHQNPTLTQITLQHKICHNIPKRQLLPHQN